MSQHLRDAIDAREAASAKVALLREQAHQLRADLVEATAEHERTLAAVDHGLGLQKLGELKPTAMKQLNDAHETASIKVRAATSACNLVIDRIQTAEQDLQQADQRLSGVAATDACTLLAAQLDKVAGDAVALARSLVLAYELDAMARASRETARGAHARHIGGTALDILAHVGIAESHTINGERFLGLTRERATMTPQQLLVMIS